MTAAKPDVSSLQHEILFLQQEHAKTLHCLQQEISSLQQKCSGLTFQLTLHGLGLSDSKSGDKQLESQDALLQTLKSENAELKRSLEVKEKRVVFLEEQLRSREHRHQDDVRSLQRRLAELDSDLNNRSAAIAYLTTQLHHMKTSALVTHRVASGGDVGALITPVPPAGHPTKERLRSATRVRSSTSPVAGTPNVGGLIASSGSSQHVAGADSYREYSASNHAGGMSPRVKQSLVFDPSSQAVGHSHTRRERDLRLASASKPKPAGYEDFIRLSARGTETSVLTKAVNEPLPPIAPSTGRQLRTTAARLQTRPTRRAKALAGEIEEVVVEPIASPDKSYAHAQDSSPLK